MPFVVTGLGEKALLEDMLDGTGGARPASLRLFANDYVPVPATTLADLIPATFTGYAPVTLAGGTWSAPVTVEGRAKSQYGSMAQQWSNTGAAAQTLYGYYIVDVTGTIVLWAERFVAPFDVAPGGVIQVWPVFTAKSEF